MENSTENLVKVSGEMAEKSQLSRGDCLTVLRRVIDLALEKYENKYTKNHERISWGRILVQATSTVNGILVNADLDDMLRRIEVLEGENFARKTKKQN